jgi:ABC-type phosphate/phosphonate transport system permease subunit
MIVREISKAQAQDTGLAAVLILLLIAFFRESVALVGPAIAVLVLDMIWPDFFRPFGFVWFSLANVLRKIVSTILLTVVFIFIATPIGLLRRLSGADPMLGKRWKDGGASVFITRDHLYSGRDLERPY